MSFFKNVCPWCAAEYYTGMVGRTPVGEGHRCRTRIECAIPGCPERSVFCLNVSKDPQQWVPLLVCPDHVGDGIIVQTQPWAGDGP